MTNAELKAIVQREEYDFLRTNKHLGSNILFLTLSGSHAYGTNVEGSDIDIRGVAGSPEILGFNHFEQAIDNRTDTVIYAVNKFVSLLAQGNPNIIELLGNDPELYVNMTPEGQMLLDNRELFLTRRIAYSYGGFANDQLRRLQMGLLRNRVSPEALKNKFEKRSLERAITGWGKDDIFEISISKDTDEEGKHPLLISCSLNDYPVTSLKPLLKSLTTTIDVQAADAMIDLSPCISIYMQAGFFNSYDIDDALAYYMDLHKDMQYLKIKKGATVEDKVLLLTALETNQCRYVKQVKPPFVNAKAKMSLSMRLGTVFTPDEYVQARGDIDIHTNDHKVIYASGLADVVKNSTVYCIKFISSLAHKHFLQCACSMIALGLPYGVVWNVKSNLMYSVKIKDKDALIDAILKCITKRAYNGADYYTCRKGFVQDTASIIDRWTDDGYAEEPTAITSGDGIAIIKQGSRYFVMDGARRNTLNDNFGLGFADVKDACLAYAKSCELQKTVDHDSPYSEVEFWLDQNKAFEEYMTQVSHEIEQHEEGPYAKYKSFATPAVRKMLAEKGLTITFPEKVLIKVWKMRRVEDAMYQKIEEAKKQNSSNVPLDEAFFDSELVDSVEGNTENTKAKAKPQKESALPFSKYGVDEKKSYRVVKSDELSKPNQPRYVVVETATDKVLDNANGYGYLSYQAAWKGYSYKSKHHLDGAKKPMSKSAKERAKKKAAFFSTDSEQLSFG